MNEIKIVGEEKSKTWIARLHLMLTKG